MKENKMFPWLITNCITLSRTLLSIAAVEQSSHGKFSTAILLLLFGIVTDIADGALARQTSVQTKFGEWHDNIADAAWGSAFISFLSFAFGNHTETPQEAIVSIQPPLLAVSFITFLGALRQGEQQARQGKHS